jgi:Protein of unknown function (DUF3987)/Domain of unknown function (DUF3854)
MNFPANFSTSVIPVLATRHYEELKGSGIADHLMALNFRTIDSTADVMSRLHRKGESVKAPGWAVQGVDPTTGFQCDEAFQFKADVPRLKENGNPLKYESPSGLTSMPLFLQDSDAGFWVNVFADPSRKIYVTEGAKKAAYLMSLGFAAISVPGVTNGQKQGHLHPLLKKLAVIGREVSIVFDGDWRQKNEVALAMDTLGRLFCASGAVVRVVDIPTGAQKGIDDYGAVHGNDAVLKLIADSLTFEAWRKPIAQMKAARVTGTELSLAEAFEEVDDLRAKDLSAPVVARELQRISKRSGIQPRELQAYYALQDADQQQKENLSDSQQDFERILKLKDAKLDVREVFPNPLGDCLVSAGRVDRLNPARYIQALLPAIGACVGSRIRLIDIVGATLEDSRYTVPLFYTVDVAPPSSGKTQANKRMMGPLDAMQSKDDRDLAEAKKRMRKLMGKLSRASKDDKQDLEQQIEDLEHDLERLRRVRIFNSGTPEGFTRTMAKQQSKAGSVLQVDEILRLMSLGKYQGKASDSEEWLLESWNGPSTARSHFANEESNYLLDGQILSICGGTQPEMAKRMFNSESDPNGKSSRWLMMRSEPEADSWMRPTGAKVSIFGELSNLYQYLESQGEQYVVMDAETQSFYWDKFEAYHKAERVQSGQNPAYSYYLGKANNHLLRIAGALHLVDCYYDRSKDIAVLTLDTIRRAAMLMKFYIGQFRIIQSEYQPLDVNLAGLQLDCYDYLRTSKVESISAYKLSRSWQRKKIGSRDIEIALDQLVTLGYAVKNGKDYSFAAESTEPKTEESAMVDQAPATEEKVVFEYHFEYIPEEFQVGDTVTYSEDSEHHQLGLIGIVQSIPEDFPEMRDIAWSNPDGEITKSRVYIHQLVETPF